MKLTNQDHEDIVWALAYVAKYVVMSDDAYRFRALVGKLAAEQDRVNQRELEMVQ